MEVNIYTSSSIKGMRAGDGNVGYVLELIKAGEPYTKCEVVPVQHLTANQSQMQALIEALKRLKKPCELNIYTDSTYISNAYNGNWIDKWIQNEWKNDRNKEIANQDRWEQLEELLKPHKYRFHVNKHHSYRKWLEEQIRRQ